MSVCPPPPSLSSPPHPPPPHPPPLSPIPPYPSLPFPIPFRFRLSSPRVAVRYHAVYSGRRDSPGGVVAVVCRGGRSRGSVWRRGGRPTDIAPPPRLPAPPRPPRQRLQQRRQPVERGQGQPWPPQERRKLRVVLLPHQRRARPSGRVSVQRLVVHRSLSRSVLPIPPSPVAGG